MNAIDFTKVQPNVELNNLQHSVNTKKKGVEIFSAMCAGKDLSKYDGKDIDTVNRYMKMKGDAAVKGDMRAKAELNAITTVNIEAPLVKRLELLSFMGEKINVGFNEEVRYKVPNIEGKFSQFQAVNGTFPFATYTWETRTMSTENITGGVMIDYREFQSGNYDAIQQLQEQTVTDMFNKIFWKVQTNLYNAIKNADIKNFEEASGLTKTAVDKVLKRAKRFVGDVTITGDYSVISQLEDMAGFKTDNAGGVRFSEAVMEEIRKTGLLKMYRGTPVVEIPNTYNLTQLNSTGDFYETYLPEGLLYFLVSGAYAPLKIGFKGGLQSMSATDINTRSEVTRYDMEMGIVVVPELIPSIGLVSDTNYEVEK